MDEGDIEINFVAASVDIALKDGHCFIQGIPPGLNADVMGSNEKGDIETNLVWNWPPSLTWTGQFFE